MNGKLIGSALLVAVSLTACAPAPPPKFDVERFTAEQERLLVTPTGRHPDVTISFSRSCPEILADPGRDALVTMRKGLTAADVGKSNSLIEAAAQKACRDNDCARVDVAGVFLLPSKEPDAASVACHDGSGIQKRLTYPAANLTPIPFRGLIGVPRPLP